VRKADGSTNGGLNKAREREREREEELHLYGASGHPQGAFVAENGFLPRRTNIDGENNYWLPGDSIPTMQKEVIVSALTL